MSFFLESGHQNLNYHLRLRALRQALVGKALSASTNIASHNNCRSEFKMLVSLLNDDISQTNAADDKESYFDVSGSLYF